MGEGGNLENIELSLRASSLHIEEVVHIVLVVLLCLRLYILYKSKDSNNNFVNIALSQRVRVEASKRP